MTIDKKRMDVLVSLGLVWNGLEYQKDDLNVHWTELTCDTDEEFNKKVELIKKKIEERE